MRPSEPCPACGEDLAATTSFPDDATGLRLLACPRCGRILPTVRGRRGRARRRRAVAVALASLAAQLVVAAGLLGLHLAAAFAVLAILERAPRDDEGRPIAPVLLSLLPLVLVVALPTGTWIGLAFRRRAWRTAATWTLVCVLAALVASGLEVAVELVNAGDPRARLRGVHPRESLAPTAAILPVSLAAFAFVPVGFGVHGLASYAARQLRRRHRRRLRSGDRT